MTEENNNPEGKMAKKLKIEIRKPEDFKQVYAIGALGGHSPYDFRIGFYNDSPKGFDKTSNSQVIQRSIETEIILSPLAALELSNWLGQHIRDYEAMFGPITRVQKQPQKVEQTEDTAEIQGYI
ncbi:DUF3467 domain-containing protein [Methanococcoides sp. FTZ1]|uniref:DUF3467 domain-containing protein n=1 Tax=Methanococcoides sp. FTZ1 TaxID=3439061 RepID=UPI003F87205D